MFVLLVTCFCFFHLSFRSEGLLLPGDVDIIPVRRLRLGIETHLMVSFVFFRVFFCFLLSTNKSLNGVVCIGGDCAVDMLFV